MDNDLMLTSLIESCLFIHIFGNDQLKVATHAIIETPKNRLCNDDDGQTNFVVVTNESNGLHEKGKK